MLAVILAVLALQGGPPEKIGICHHTGSATNPYVLLELPPPAVKAHLKHDGDVIATEGVCPPPPVIEEPPGETPPPTTPGTPTHPIVVCPMPPTIEIPVLVPIDRPVAAPPHQPVEVITAPQEKQPEAVVITPPNRPLTCKRINEVNGALRFECKPRRRKPTPTG